MPVAALMPPEPLPWDRNKDRKRERGSGFDALAGGAASCYGGPRWRDNFCSHVFPRASPRRPPLGHYMQGSCYHHIYPDESSGDRLSDRFWSEDDRWYSGAGRSISRDGRGCFSRSPYSDCSNFSRQQHHKASHLPPPRQPLVTGLRSVAVPITSSFTPKDLHENKHGDDESVADDSLGLVEDMPQIWIRPGRLSKAHNEDASVPSGKETPVQSPPASSVMADEGMPRKKPRLGWGEGLAKYEKKKVEGSDDGSGKSGLVEKTTCESPSSPSPPGSTSPVTPVSVVCSSSPGVEEKPSMNIVNDNIDIDETIELPCTTSEFSYEDKLKLLLSDLLQKEDNCSGESGSMAHDFVSKLLLLKGDISKELEKTENDIDQLEIELRTLNSHDSKDLCHNTCYLQDGYGNGHCRKVAGDHIMVTPGDCVLESPAAALTGELAPHMYARGGDHDVEDAHICSTYTVSSEIGKDTSSDKELLSSYDNQKGEGSPSTSMKAVIDEMPTALADGGGCAIVLSDANIMEDDCGPVRVVAGDCSSVCDEADVVELITSSNKDAASKASQVFNCSMPTGSTKYDIWEPNKLLSLSGNYIPIGQILKMRSRSIKFKERLAAFHYRVAYFMWKEHLYLFSLRKRRTKSKKRPATSVPQKRLVLNFPLFEMSGILKQHSHSSTFLQLLGISLKPTTETVNFFSKLMQDSQVEIQRECLRMPACVLQEERRHFLFPSDNGLVEDPISFEKERLILNPWTKKEKEIFMKMLATYGKDFSKIASFVPHKTTADCIEFYYKNHKGFKEVKKRFKQQSNCNYMTSGKKWKHEGTSSPISMLRDSAVVPAYRNDVSDVNQFYSQKSISSICPDFKVSNSSCVFAEKSNPVEVTAYDNETVAANVLAGISSIRSSEVVCSGVTSNSHPAKKLNFLRADCSLTPEIGDIVDEEDNCSDEAYDEMEAVDWTDDEKSSFIRALSIYGKDFSRISNCIKTRSREQCRIFFSKARKCLGLDTIHQGSGWITLRSDTNGVRSDAEDACGIEMYSGIWSTQLYSKVDAHFTQSMANTGECSIKTEKSCRHVEAERSLKHCDTAGSIVKEVETKTDEMILDRREVSQSCSSLKNVDNGVFRYNESAQKLGASDPYADMEIKSETGNPSSGACVAACLEAPELKPLHTSVFVRDCIYGHSHPSLLKDEGEAGTCPIPKDDLQDRSHQLEIDSQSMDDNNRQGEALVASTSPISSNCYKDQIYSRPHTCMEANRAISYGSSLCSISVSALNSDDDRKLSSNTCFDQVGMPSVLKGYPLPVLDRKEKNVEPILVGPAFVESTTDSNRTSQVKSISTSSSLNGFCNISNFPPTRSENLCSLGNDVLSDSQLRLCSKSDCAEGEDTEIRTGDVKLFGKILSNPSTMHKKLSYFADESSSKLPFPILNRSTALNLPDRLKNDGNLVGSGSGNAIHLGSEEVPSRTYGFWDGTRIQTGYSKLPESAKSQGSVGGVSIFSSKESSQGNDGIFTDYQQPYIQGLDGRSSIQQQSTAGCLGVNLMGGGVMVNGGGGGDSNGVSDPAAAIEMHYTRAKFRGEKDSWSGGDICRR